MRFDSSAATQAAVRRSLKLDPRLIRFSVVKLAQRLGTRQHIAGIEAIEGKVDWMAPHSWQDVETTAFLDRNNQRLTQAYLDSIVADEVAR